MITDLDRSRATGRAYLALLIDDDLPTHELARALRVALSTARTAMRHLERRGEVSSRAGPRTGRRGRSPGLWHLVDVEQTVAPPTHSCPSDADRDARIKAHRLRIEAALAAGAANPAPAAPRAPDHAVYRASRGHCPRHAHGTEPGSVGGRLLALLRRDGARHSVATLACEAGTAVRTACEILRRLHRAHLVVRG